jgi:hypothetical protein
MEIIMSFDRLPYYWSSNDAINAINTMNACMQLMQYMQFMQYVYDRQIDTIVFCHVHTLNSMRNKFSNFYLKGVKPFNVLLGLGANYKYT